MTNPNRDPKKPNYFARRIGAAVMAIVAGAAAIEGYHVVTSGVEAAATAKVNHDKQQIEQDKIDAYFNRSDAVKVSKQYHNSPTKVAYYTIQSKDTPIAIAKDIAAKGSFANVVNQISNQEGGADTLQPGDDVVLPISELDPKNVHLVSQESQYVNTGVNADGQIQGFEHTGELTYIMPISPK